MNVNGFEMEKNDYETIKKALGCNTHSELCTLVTRELDADLSPITIKNRLSDYSALSKGYSAGIAGLFTVIMGRKHRLGLGFRGYLEMVKNGGEVRGV